MDATSRRASGANAITDAILAVGDITMRPRLRLSHLMLFTIAAVSVTFIASAPAADLPPSREGLFVLRDFAFDSGERLPELRIHYLTLGTLHRDAAGQADNAVLVLHGTGGAGRNFLTENFAGVLFGPGQLLDATRYFLVLPDGIGHGGSSRPRDGLRARFPRYGYRDMVRAQHRLLTEGLGVDHLRLVMGTSMGGMHTWLWGETHPDFMDALMPLASLPTEIAGRNRMMRRMVIDSIRNDPEWKGGDYTTQPRGLASAVHTLLFMVSSPLRWQEAAPTREAADRFFDEQMKARLEGADANDMLYQFEASRDYDPGPGLEAIRAPLVAINSADDQVNPPELGILEKEIRRVRRGRAVVLPISAETRGHGTHSWPALWQDHLAALLRESEPARSSSSLSPAP
jgi:homoserine O-acetyltransferase